MVGPFADGTWSTARTAVDGGDRLRVGVRLSGDSDLYRLALVSGRARSLLGCRKDCDRVQVRRFPQ